MPTQVESKLELADARFADPALRIVETTIEPEQVAAPFPFCAIPLPSVPVVGAAVAPVPGEMMTMVCPAVIVLSAPRITHPVAVEELLNVTLQLVPSAPEIVPPDV
jgi:hypothetical protein